LRTRKNQHTHIFTALKDITFSLPKGHTIGIIGRNGSGKSTLLRIICDVLSPSEGSVKTGGRIAALLELGAGFNPEFTGRENVIFSASLLGLSKKEITDKFSEIEAFADIGEFIDQPVKIYSSGMYARLAFAVAINVTPDILVIDEALAVGDEVFQRKCFAKLDHIKKTGTTILFVSHSGASIINLCDRVLLLHKGELLFDGEPKRGVYYLQKIGNSDANEMDNIISEIKAERIFVKDDSHETSMNVNTINAMDEAKHFQEKIIISDTKYTEFFDPDLISHSASSYEPKGAIISSVELMTEKNITVNHLINGRRYKFKVAFNFLSDCENVRAYALIRTIDGIDLAGCAYPNLHHTGFSAIQNEKIIIDFEFDCKLNQGTYFCNFALQAQDGSLHHRLVDTIAFRVIHISPGHVTGLVDLGYNPVFQREGMALNE
jgi:lipopolysaccharide transport system ATP-binding protein